MASGITYYCDCRDLSSISNPIINNGVKMKHGGFFVSSWNQYETDFEDVCYGLRKTKANQGLIYCNDASKLFGMSFGYVGLTLELPNSITDGIYTPLLNSNVELNEYILWGVNLGKTEASYPSVYAKLTKNGIEFTIWSSLAKFSMIDAYTSVLPNTSFFIEFIWSKDILDGVSLPDFDATMAIRVNNQTVVVGNSPIATDSISDLNFYAIDTPFNYSNLDCIIRKIVTANQLPSWIEEEWDGSSSSGT